MPHLYQAVFRIVGIGVGFCHAALPARCVRVGHGLRLSRESIAGGGHLVSVQQVALHGLGHLSLDIIVISRVQRSRCAVGGVAFVGQHVPRRGHIRPIVTPVAVVAAVPGRSRPVLPDGAVQQGNVEKSNPCFSAI